MSEILIEHRFTSLNDYIEAERSNKYIAAHIKKNETEIARVSALTSGVTIDRYPVSILFQWHRTDQRTDPDNIQFGAKFILDGLVKAGVLENDSWKHIKGIQHEFFLSAHDYVTVVFLEAK